MSRVATAFRRDVQVGDVVGDVAAAGLHGFGGPVGTVDVLAPQHVVDAEFVGAVSGVADLVANAMPSRWSDHRDEPSARPSSCSCSGSGRTRRFPRSGTPETAWFVAIASPAPPCRRRYRRCRPRAAREPRQQQPAGEGSQGQRQAGGDGARATVGRRTASVAQARARPPARRRGVGVAASAGPTGWRSRRRGLRVSGGLALHGSSCGDAGVGSRRRWWPRARGRSGAVRPPASSIGSGCRWGNRCAAARSRGRRPGSWRS